MNWLDLLILVLLGLAAATGHRRGFIIEVCSLAALFLGVYGALHFSDVVAEWIGLGPDRRITAFLITFLIVLMLVHLIGKALTTLIDIAMLGWANRIAGIGAGILRSAFMLSIMLNILLAYTDGTIPSAGARAGSTLAAPLRAFAPMVLPALGETKWVQQLLEDVKKEAQRWADEAGQE